MVERAVLPDLRRRSGDTGVIVSRTLRNLHSVGKQFYFAIRHQPRPL